MSAAARAWCAAVGVTAVTVGLVLADVLASGMRTWWVDHPFTTAVVTGLLVLLVTVLVADRVIERRRLRERSRAIAAQASIVYGQAVRASDAVRNLLQSDAETAQDAEDAAGDEMRSYTMTLMIAAPMLIDDAGTRTFLEGAQSFGVQLTVALNRRRKGTMADEAQLIQRLDTGLGQLRDVARPLAASLSPRLRAAVEGRDIHSAGDGSGDADRDGPQSAPGA